MSKVIEVNAADFSKSVLGSDKPVLVDFWAPWCGPCLMMGPVLDELSTRMGDDLVVAKVNVDDPENGALAMEYEIQGIPNMKLFKSGAVVKEFVGMRPLAMLESEIRSNL